jgi:histidinol-phosphate aminotransferase
MLACLRPDVPTSGSFTVTELPSRAKLDQNEAAVDLPAELKRALVEELCQERWNRYPQPKDYREAKTKLAAALGLVPECVALTVGCDQVIQAAFLIAGGPGRRARWFEPTYPYIALAADATSTGGGAVVLGEDVDAEITPARVLFDPAPHLCVLVRPNNPTGGMASDAALSAALEDPARLVLLDEAYADFAGESRLDAIQAHPNLLIGRSLSKSLLAAVRLGFAVGHPEAISAIERIYTAPYHLNSLQLRVAARYGEILPYVRDAARAVAGERERVFAALAALSGVTPRPSRANFVLFRLERDAVQAHRALAQAGVRVRNLRGLPGLAAHLRVTVGTRAENDLFLAALEQALSSLP